MRTGSRRPKTSSICANSRRRAWGPTPSPALSTPKVGDLVAVEVTHPDAAVRALAEQLDVGLVVSDGPARLTARIATANGEVVLESSPG